MASRLHGTRLFFIGWITLLIARLIYIQVLQHDALSARARKQHLSSLTIRLHRALIIDRNGRKLALNERVYSLYLHPNQIKERDSTLHKLAVIIAIPVTTLQRQVQWNLPFQWIRRKGLDAGQAAAIQNLHLRGVGVIPEDARIYPHRELAGPVIGFVGIDNQGLGGMEFAYDRQLQGKKYRIPILRDGLKRRLWFDPDIFNMPSMNRALQLSLDLYAQYLAERILERWIRKTGAIRGLIIGMNPHTGEILFHAQHPGYDPNHYQSALRNPYATLLAAAQWRFEPGSTFKPVIAAAALAYRPSIRAATFDGGNGQIRLYNVLIRDHDAFKQLSFSDVLVHSSNVGAIRIALQIPPQWLSNAFDRWGFRRTSGSDFPGERPGIIRPLRSWAKIDPAYYAIGQGLAVTPLNLLRFYAAIANGGRIVHPRFARALIDQQGKETSLLIKSRQSLLPPLVVQQIRDILIDVVRRGTGKRAALPGFLVAGKTGTAEKVGTDGSYMPGHYIASFVGFFPAKNPRVLIMVMLDEPKTQYYGGEVAAPAFRELAEELIHLWHLNPEESPRPYLAQSSPRPRPSPASTPLGEGYALAHEIARWPDFRRQTPEQVYAWARQMNVNVAFVGAGPHIVAQFPLPGSPLSIQHGIFWLEPPPNLNRLSDGTRYETRTTLSDVHSRTARMAPPTGPRDRVGRAFRHANPDSFHHP